MPSFPFFLPLHLIFPIFLLSLSVDTVTAKDKMVDISKSTLILHPVLWRKGWGLKFLVLSLSQSPG